MNYVTQNWTLRGYGPDNVLHILEEDLGMTEARKLIPGIQRERQRAQMEPISYWVIDNVPMGEDL